MNIRQYQLQIQGHNFLHDSNCHLTRQKYQERPDISCPICHLIAQQNLPADFLKFWDWYRVKYNAYTITSNTLESFQNTILAESDREREIYIKTIPVSVRYCNSTPNKDFDQIYIELSKKFEKTQNFTVETPQIQSEVNSDSSSEPEEEDNNSPTSSE